MPKPGLYKQIPSIWFDFESIYDEAVASAPPGSILVEVGSFWGQSAVYLAEAAKLANKQLKVYCVDTWAMHPENNPSLFTPKAGAVEPPVHEAHNNSLFETFAHFVDRTRLSPDPLRIMRMSSLEAADLLGWKALHFVFLDGDHDFKYVHQELCAWTPMIASKGFIAGHDYTNEWGVIEATDKFFGKGKVEVRQGERTKSWVMK